MSEKCSNCNYSPPEVNISWVATTRQSSDVCVDCARLVWEKLSVDFSGTDSFATFTVLPITPMI